MQQRCENPPTGIQLVVTNKVGMVAFQSVKNESFVGLRDLKITEATPIGKIKLSNSGLHAKAWKLGVHFNINALIWLDANDELVSRDVLEDTTGDVLELDSNFGLLLVQGWYSCQQNPKWGETPGFGPQAPNLYINESTFSSLQNERHTVPPFILNIDR